MRVRRMCEEDEQYSISGYLAIKAIKDREEKKKKQSQFMKMVKEYLKAWKEKK